MPDPDAQGSQESPSKPGFFAGVAGISGGPPGGSSRARQRRPGQFKALPDAAGGFESGPYSADFGADDSGTGAMIASLAVAGGDGDIQMFPESGAPDEVSELRRQIKEKDHAILRAVLSVQDLQEQLAAEKEESLNLRTELSSMRDGEAKSLPAATDAAHGPDKPPLSPEAQLELDRQRKEWAKIQRSLERQHNQRKTELASVRAQWFQTQQQLESESRARRLENAQASATISRLERNLSTASEALTQVQRGSGKSVGKRITMVTVLATTLIGVGLMWTQFSAKAGTAASTVNASSAIPAANTVAAPASVLPKAAATSLKPIQAPPAEAFSQASFQGSLSRLNRALAAYGNKPPQEILKEIRQRSGDQAVCAFQWNNGQPALVYGSEGLHASLASALTRCAAAVELSH